MKLYRVKVMFALSGTISRAINVVLVGLALLHLVSAPVADQSSLKIVNDGNQQQQAQNRQETYEKNVNEEDNYSENQHVKLASATSADYIDLDPERDFYFYNEQPLDLDEITFLSSAWKRSGVDEFEVWGKDDESNAKVGLYEQEVDGRNIHGDISKIKGANSKWPLNWISLLEFPAQQFFKKKICKTQLTNCDWQKLVFEVAKYFVNSKEEAEKDETKEVIWKKSQAAVLSAALLYEQISLFYHATLCGHMEEKKHCPQPCSSLADPCEKYPGTECVVVKPVGEQMMNDLYNQNDRKVLLLNNIRTHKCVCREGFISLGSLLDSVDSESDEKAYWDNKRKEKVLGGGQKFNKWTQQERDSALLMFIREKKLQGAYCVPAEETPPLNWKLTKKKRLS